VKKKTVQRKNKFLRMVIGMAKSMMGFELYPMESQNLTQTSTKILIVKDTLQGSLKSISESEEKTKVLGEWKYL